MHANLRRAGTAMAAMLALVSLAPAVMAAAPSSDIFSGATSASIGFSEVLDTSEATTDADDAQLNTYCGAPATDASVWYVLEGTDEGVIVDVSKSSYSAGVLVGLGTQGNLEVVACGPGSVGFFAALGKPYYVLAIDDQSDGAGNGGELNISFNAAPPPPTIDVTVNSSGTVNTRTGVATISGTLTCTNSDFFDMYAEGRQAVGRFVISGSGWLSGADCDGAPHAWSMDIYPNGGKFAGGKLATFTFTYACGAFECADAYVEATVMLRGKR